MPLSDLLGSTTAALILYLGAILCSPDPLGATIRCALKCGAFAKRVLYPA